MSKEKITESLVPEGKFCDGCDYFDIFLYYSCQALNLHCDYDEEKREYLKRCGIKTTHPQEKR